MAKKIIKFPIFIILILKTGCARPLLKKNLRTNSFFFFFGCFCRKFCHADVNSRKQQERSDPAQKSGKNQAKIAFLMFSGENVGTILSRRSRLSRTSRAPSRRIRPCPIDCDAGHDRQTMISRFFEEEKHIFFFRARHLVVIYTPQEPIPPSSGDLHPKRSP